MPTDTNNQNIFDVGTDNFQTEVLQGSLKIPVLIDFWADWCGPCKALGPILEKLANEYNGAFRLGKVDIDKNQELAGMFGVRSIPAVMLVKDGQIIDGFTGALPEQQLRQFLNQHVQPLDSIKSAPEAPEVTDTEIPEQMIERLRQAMQADPTRSELKLDLAQALIRSGAIADAATELESLPANLATDSRAIKLRYQIELADTLKNSPPADLLQSRLDDNDQDWEAHDLLGLHLLFSNTPEQGLRHWLLILEKARDWHDGQAKKRLLAAFQVLDNNELISRYRRKMASLLF